MRILNTSRHYYIGSASCPLCYPTDLPLSSRVAFKVVAWQVPEPTCAEMLHKRLDWFRCTVCLGQMFVIACPADRSMAERLLDGRPAKPDSIELFP